MLHIDLSSARPSRSDGPSSSLVLSVLDGKSSSEPVVLWKKETKLRPQLEALDVELGPLPVAGNLQLAVTLDGAHVYESPMPLRVMLAHRTQPRRSFAADRRAPASSRALASRRSSSSCSTMPTATDAPGVALLPQPRGLRASTR